MYKRYQDFMGKLDSDEIEKYGSINAVLVLAGIQGVLALSLYAMLQVFGLIIMGLSLVFILYAAFAVYTDIQRHNNKGEV